ncbi:MAG: response regulator, partial [Anaerolineae bacterium]|nr:response regulator [Anaerolineae bacterium]
MNTDTQDQNALIMVVDDNPEFLSGIELTLEMEGFKVWTSDNGKNAMDQLEKAFLLKQRTGGSGLEGLPDLILADIMMPEM